MKATSWVSKITTSGALALVISCSQGANKPSERTESIPEAMVTVRGTNVQDVRSALFALDDVQITADEQSVPARTETAKIDLANSNEQVAARFRVPARAHTIRIVLRFDDFGGYESQNGEAGVIDARGTRLNVELPARSLAERGKAQLSIDVARSLAARSSSGRLLTPHFELSY